MQGVSPQNELSVAKVNSEKWFETISRGLSFIVVQRFTTEWQEVLVAMHYGLQQIFSKLDFDDTLNIFAYFSAMAAPNWTNSPYLKDN